MQLAHDPSAEALGYSHRVPTGRPHAHISQGGVWTFSSRPYGTPA